MTTVVSSVPALALNATSRPSRTPILLMPDGWRVILYSDGTNLKYSLSQNGSSWSAAATAITGVTAVPATLCAVMGSATLFVFQLAGTSITCAYAPYTTGGTLGSWTTTTPITGLTGTPQALCAVYDPNGVTADGQHVSGTTGLIHLLADTGNWSLYCLDPHTTATIPKQVFTSTVATGITSPTYATNLALRVSGNAKLYALSPTTSGTWTGCEISCPQPSASYSAGTPTYIQNVTAGSGGVQFYAQGATIDALDSHAAGVAPTTSTPTRVVAQTFTSGYTFPAGTWTLSIVNAETNLSGTFHTSVATVYAVTAGGVATTIGTLPNGSGSLPSFTVAAGGSLQVSGLIIFDSALTSTAAGAVKWTGAATLATTATGSTLYSAGTLESPAMNASTAGAALCPSDTTSNPGVDIAYNDSGTMRVLNRSNAGVYSNAQSIDTSATTGIAPAIVSNTGTGNDALLYQKSGHVWKALRTSGAWGVAAQEDTSATTLQGVFAPIVNTGLGTAGAAIAYVNGSSPYNLQYEDAGFAAGVSAPTAPDVAIVSTGSVTNAYGVQAPFVATTTTPTVEITFNEATSGDRLFAAQVLFYDEDTQTASPATVASGDVTITTTGGSIGAGVVQIARTYTTAAGETLPSAVYSTAALTGSTNEIAVASPAAVGSATGWNLYLSAPGGTTLTKQNSSPLAVGTGSGTKTTITTTGSTPPPFNSTGTLVWNSDMTAVAGGPLPGGTLDLVYNQFGAAAASALTAGHKYQIGVYVTEGIGGNISPAGGSEVYIQSAPVATSVTPATVTAISPTVACIYTQAEGVAAASYQYQFVRYDGQVGYDTGVVAQAIANNGGLSVPITLAGQVTDNVAYAHVFTFWTNPASGPAWSGSTTTSTSTSIPVGAAPTNLSAVWNAGATVSGGSIDVTYTVPTSTPAVASNNFYLRESGTGSWSYVGNKTVPTGTGTCSLYSVADFLTYDVGVSSVDTNGLESAIIIYPNVYVEFTDGFWLNQASDPTICVELGRIGDSDAFHRWDNVQTDSWDELYDRKSPVRSLGTTFYKQTNTEVQFRLKSSLASQIYDQLDAWQQNGTPVQIRDWQGRILYGSILQSSPSAAETVIPSTYILLRQMDVAGKYNLLLA